MNTTPTMTLERERADAASARRPEPKPATGSFQTVEPRIEVAPAGATGGELVARYGEQFVPGAGEAARKFEVGLGRLDPEQVGVLGVGEAAGDDRLDAVLHLVEPLGGALTGDERPRRARRCGR